VPEKQGPEKVHYTGFDWQSGRFAKGGFSGAATLSWGVFSDGEVPGPWSSAIEEGQTLPVAEPLVHAVTGILPGPQKPGDGRSPPQMLP